MLANSCRAVVGRAAGQIPRTCVGSSRSTSARTNSSIALRGLRISGRMTDSPLNGASLAVDARRAYATGEKTEEGEEAAAGGAIIPNVSTKKVTRSKPSGKAKTAMTSKPRTKKGKLGRPLSKSSTARRSTKAKAEPTSAKKVAAKAKKKPKKTMTPEDKRKEKIRALVKLALKPPYGNHPQTAWTMFLGERMRNSDQPSASQRLSAVESSRMYQNLSPAEMEHYNHLANQESLQRSAAKQEWIHQHSPKEIRQANAARRELARLYPEKYKTLHLIRDDRRPVRTRSGYLRFSVERRDSGDFKHIKASDVIRLIAQEWRELPAPEKERWNAMGAADRRRYRQEFSAFIGLDPTPPTPRSSP